MDDDPFQKSNIISFSRLQFSSSGNGPRLITTDLTAILERFRLPRLDCSEHATHPAYFLSDSTRYYQVSVFMTMPKPGY